jgi:hypothetical protein
VCQARCPDRGDFQCPLNEPASLRATALIAIARLAFAAPPASLHLKCDDFKQNDDGSWSSVHTVKIMKPNGTGVKMGPGTSFGAGSVFGGVHLAEMLQKACPSH